jgi:hypothetical protein
MNIFLELILRPFPYSSGQRASKATELRFTQTDEELMDAFNAQLKSPTRWRGFTRPQVNRIFNIRCNSLAQWELTKNDLEIYRKMYPGDTPWYWTKMASIDMEDGAYISTSTYNAGG